MSLPRSLRISSITFAVPPGLYSLTGISGIFTSVPQEGQYFEESIFEGNTRKLQLGHLVAGVPLYGRYRSRAAFRYETGNENPRLSPPFIINVFTPITSPLIFTKGPPLLPGLIAASIWIKCRP